MKNLSYLSDGVFASNSVWFIIRHGENEEPPENEPFLDVGLTVKGNRDARAFGESLREKFPGIIEGVYSSPLKRCIETSISVLEGVKGRVDIEKSTVLGDPGAFIADENVAGDSFRKLFPRNIVKLQVDGTSIPGFRTVEEGSSILLKYVFVQKPREGLHLFVTHDVLIAALIGCLIGGIPDIPNWIRYLQGVCFFDEKDRIMMDIPEGQYDVTNRIEELLLDERRNES